MLDADEIIERFCKLQCEVFLHINCGASDCFCKKSGFWGAKDYGGTYEKGYRNTGEALEFIEAAVREALKKKWLTR